MKLTHPHSGRTVETDEERAPRYLDQGWRPVVEPEPDVEPDTEVSSSAPTKKAAPSRTNSSKGQGE